MKTRDRIIKTTCNLLETQGYHATAINQIVKQSKAPKGSMYYHFPGGKQELAEVAVQQSGEIFSKLIIQNFREDIPLCDAVEEFVLGIAKGIAKGVESSGYSAGGPLTAIAVETATTNERINLACRESFSKIQAAFQKKIIIAGIEEEKASELAIFIIASIEGGIMLSRTHHSVDPLYVVSKYLKTLLKEL